jgi:hypothetical protein
MITSIEIVRACALDAAVRFSASTSQFHLDLPRSSGRVSMFGHSQGTVVVDGGCAVGGACRALLSFRYISVLMNWNAEL